MVVYPWIVMTTVMGTKLTELPAPGAKVRYRIYLCRHGETDYNAEGKIQGCGIDRPLSTNGRKQAEALGQALKDVPLDLVGSSTLQRSMETAKAVWRHHHSANSIEHRGLREMSFGDFEGKTPDEIRTDYDAVIQSWAAGDVDTKWPNGESPRDVEARVRDALKDLFGGKSQRGLRHVALVTHGRLNKILLSSLLGFGLHTHNDLTQANCCINVLDLLDSDDDDDDDGFAFVAPVLLNYADHLQHLLN